MFLTSARALHNGSSVCVIPLRGKATADGEPASVTDEEPAHDSTGRCGPVDLGLALPTSSLVRSDLKDYVDRRTRCYLCYVHQCATGFILTLLHRQCQRATAQVFPTGTGITSAIHKSNKTESNSSHPPPAHLQPSPQTANDVASTGAPQAPPPADKIFLLSTGCIP